jgi:hypothetical protein
MLLIWDNLTGHKTPELLFWMFAQCPELPRGNEAALYSMDRDSWSSIGCLKNLSPEN